ncbi:DUF5677 domain-containing protein [Zobellia sp. B3R18]|uniref:DUF5677 domain-containing protein n=1 Tax=Zobellia sp. B3R18 TaxID=2841568 RepID=UPI001C06751E|nr:DUF5677 domain-containing protein [Zobellia sp. B3R18]MBU2976485.1 hypothetical protein [Zobellia sp. B3R18]
MSAKKKRSRIRQTRTEFQKAFDPYPGMIVPFSWSERLPEFLHISIALNEFDYETVKKDFAEIADYVNDKFDLERKFHFNLTHTVKLIKENNELLDIIFKTSFKKGFEQILGFYSELFDFKIEYELKPDIKPIFLGYKEILDGRSDISILCKYLMVQYKHIGQEDPFQIFNWNGIDEILNPMNVSRVMSLFPPSIGQSEYLDLELCESIWLYNYVRSPLMPKPDDSKMEEDHYKEMNIEKLTDELKQLYSEFKELNLLSIYPKFIAEVNMGFIARICNLTFDVVDLVKTHKGEIAEIVFRTTLESFIVGSWLYKRKDLELHKRFRDFTTGRDKFFGQKIAEQAVDDKMKKEAEKMVADAIKEAGVREISVATERGDIFDLRIDQMAEEVWGKDNQYYFLYKRTSGVVHGQWQVIAKYHLAKSFNPMHNGLYWYNDNKNHFAGLIPAFCCLPLASNFLIRALEDFEEDDVKELKEKLLDIESRIWEQYMVYYKKYILPNEEKAE